MPHRFTFFHPYLCQSRGNEIRVILLAALLESRSNPKDRVSPNYLAILSNLKEIERDITWM